MLDSQTNTSKTAAVGFTSHPPRISQEEIQQTLDSQLPQGEDYRVNNNKLQMLRAQNPFLPILPFPNSTITILIPTGGVATDINLPPGTKLIFISGSDEYYISRNGNAQIPGQGNSDPGTQIDYKSGSYQNPEGFFIYVEEMNQFSVITVNGGVRISIACYIQL